MPRGETTRVSTSLPRPRQVPRPRQAPPFPAHVHGALRTSYRAELLNRPRVIDFAPADVLSSFWSCHRFVCSFNAVLTETGPKY
jgi:hypothetical protein